MTSTPEPSSRRRSGTLLVKLSAHDNPWLPPGAVEEMRKEAGDELTARREVDGEIVGDQGSLWKHFDAARHTRDGAEYTVEDYLEGVWNVTLQATRNHWKGRNPYTREVVDPNPAFVAGMDFNTWPMSAVVGSVYGDPSNPAGWGLWIADVVQLGTSGRGATSKAMGDWLQFLRAARTSRPSYPNLRIACDPSGAYFAVDQIKSKAKKASATDAKFVSEGGHDCRPCRFVRGASGKASPAAPPVHDSISLVEKLFREDRLVIHGRCRELIHSLQTQEDAGDGTPVKVSGTASDRLSSTTDALRYLVWALFSSEFTNARSSPSPGFVPGGTRHR